MTVTAQLNKTRVNVNETVDLELQLSTNGSNQIRLPDISQALKDFDVLSRSQSSQISMINGAVSNTQTYLYTLMPRRTGTLIIPAFQFQYQNQPISTKPVQLDVVTATAANTPANASKQSATNPSAANPSRPIGGDFLEAVTEKQSYYIGEPIIYSLKFFSRRNMYTQISLKPAEPNNLMKFPGIQSQQTQSQTNLNGLAYGVSELRDVFYATKVGKASFGASSLKLYSFFGPEKTLQSNVLDLNIMALPNKSNGSFSGFIGDFTVTTSLSKTSLKANDGITLKMIFQGEGDLGSGKAPEIRVNQDIELFAPKRDVKVDFSTGKILSSLTLEYLLIPRNKGTYIITFDPLNYFSLSQKRYIETTIPKLTISVYGTTTSIAQTTTGTLPNAQDVRIETNDIHYIDDSLRNLYSSTPFQRLVIQYAKISAIPFVLAIITLFIKWGYRHHQGTKTFLASQAYKRFNKGISRLSHLIKKQQWDEFYSELGRTIDDYLQKKSLWDGRPLSSTDFELYLIERCGQTNAAIPALVELHSLCSEYRFSPNKTLAPDQAKQHLFTAQQSIQWIEKHV